MNADEALAQFKKDGDVKQIKRKFPEVAALDIREKDTFVSGTLLRMREVAIEGNERPSTFVNIKLKATNAKATKKASAERGADGKYTYVPADVKEGDEISLIAPSRLAQDLKEVVPGTEIYIRSLGKAAEVKNGRKTFPYKFDVRAKAGENAVLPF